MFTRMVFIALACCLANVGWVYAAETMDGVLSHGSKDLQQMPWGPRQDAAFLAGMIVHHEGAISMVEGILKITNKPVIQQWGRDILDAQVKEITEMEGMLKEIGLDDDESRLEMQHMMDEMTNNPVSEDPDINFVSLMATHHAGAIDMALPALALSTNPDVRQLAEQIIVSQAREIAEFRDWLDNRELVQRVSTDS